MWSSCPWVSTMATTSSSRSRIEVKSGRITSIPGWWSSGKRTPQSTTSSLPWYSKTVMLRPISPSPPKGVTRRTPRARRGGDFRFLVWAGCTRSILPESGPIGPGQRTSEGGPARRHTLRTSCVRQQRRPPDPKVRRASDPRSRCSGGRIRSAGTFSTRREAERAAGRQDYKISDGSWIDPAGGRIGFHAYAMEVWLPSRHLEVTTRAGYLSYLRNHFVPYFGSTPLSDITPSMVQHWVRQAVDNGLPD